MLPFDYSRGTITVHIELIRNTKVYSSVDKNLNAEVSYAKDSMSGPVVVNMTVLGSYICYS